MKQLSEKLTRYVIKDGSASEESYAIYQYGFQIGLEMLCCFVVCLGIAIYLHMVSKFVVFTDFYVAAYLCWRCAPKQLWGMFYMLGFCADSNFTYQRNV